MTIKINHHVFDTITLYKRSNTYAQRALAGYIIHSGKTNDPVLGGAFHVLCAIERCNETGEIYELFNLLNGKEKREILDKVQAALDGKFDKYMFNESTRKSMIKNLSEPM
jgi:hypothetical protein